MRTTWWSRRAIKVHLIALVVVPACAALCVWQVHRALSGNELSWAYVFEWPIFAAYAVFMWWRLLHIESLVDGEEGDAPRRTRRSTVANQPEPAMPAVAAPGPATEAGVAPGATGAEAEPPSVPATATAEAEPKDEDEDAELKEYNRYLAALNASGRRKRW